MLQPVKILKFCVCVYVFFDAVKTHLLPIIFGMVYYNLGLTTFSAENHGSLLPFQ